jgi:hypothetical protein
VNTEAGAAEGGAGDGAPGADGTDTGHELPDVDGDNTGEPEDVE